MGRRSERGELRTRQQPSYGPRDDDVLASRHDHDVQRAEPDPIGDRTPHVLAVLDKAEVIRVYLPPDANTLLSVTDHCLRSSDNVNVIVAGKQPAPMTR